VPTRDPELFLPSKAAARNILEAQLSAKTAQESMHRIHRFRPDLYMHAGYACYPKFNFIR
jgi:hypothetical protein